MTPLEQISKDTQKKQTKETYERDIRKRHTKKTDERDIRKRHTKETDERDIRKIHTKETCIQRILIFVLPAQVRLNNMMKLLYLRNNFEANVLHRIDAHPLETYVCFAPYFCFCVVVFPFSILALFKSACIKNFYFCLCIVAGDELIGASHE